jgi:hypothetical protein
VVGTWTDWIWLTWAGAGVVEALTLTVRGGGETMLTVAVATPVQFTVPVAVAVKVPGLL